mgnify:CR=1 FL=1|jgi:hypothetical protein
MAHVCQVSRYRRDFRTWYLEARPRMMAARVHFDSHRWQVVLAAVRVVLGMQTDKVPATVKAPEERGCVVYTVIVRSIWGGGLDALSS